jgi:deazaflavin-dependent oxidoreductase (nitroreductase family)
VRIDKRRASTALSVKVVNPLVRHVAGTRLAPGYALLETIGRKSGQPRRTPVGNGLETDNRTFWIVTEHGRRAGYVRNIENNPLVRLKIKGRWHEGTARTAPDEDPRERQRKMGHRLNGAMVRAMGTELLTVRVDLRPKA